MNTNNRFERECELRNEACKYEMQGNHEKAMECLKEICEVYNNYGHMVILAHDYAKGRKTESGQFPQNAEYQLECLLLAVEKDPGEIMAPIFASELANRLGKTELAEALEKLAQERGVWEYTLFRFNSGSNLSKLSRHIAKLYREGIGCAKSEEIARWYDRLAEGETQAVLKEMVLAEFAPVLKMMTSRCYYEIRSLSELDGVSEEFKTKFLYGSDDKPDMPEWFVSLVNSLNVYDRNEVLSKAYAILEQRYEDILGKLRSGEYELVDGPKDFEWDSDAFSVRINGRLRVINLLDCSLLTYTDKTVELQQLVKRFEKAVNDLSNSNK